jgi:hypothetical protein
MLPQPRIGDDRDQKTDIGALVRREAQICDMAKTNFRRDRFQRLREIMLNGP